MLRDPHWQWQAEQIRARHQEILRRATLTEQQLRDYVAIRPLAGANLLTVAKDDHGLLPVWTGRGQRQWGAVRHAKHLGTYPQSKYRPSGVGNGDYQLPTLAGSGDQRRSSWWASSRPRRYFWYFVLLAASNQSQICGW
ncbi:MAG: hypothetical protein LC776_00620 [Acidobacteria bacterium]|nr:hypothetical protein [Acidobacteriota bacterium]